MRKADRKLVKAAKDKVAARAGLYRKRHLINAAIDKASHKGQTLADYFTQVRNAREKE
jgi:hypothetical protein